MGWDGGDGIASMDMGMGMGMDMDMDGRWMGDGIEGVVASLSLSLFDLFDLFRLYSFNHQTCLPALSADL